MTITLLSGEMLSPDLKREKLFNLVCWYGPHEVPPKPLKEVFTLKTMLGRAPPQDPLEHALATFKEFVAAEAPQANYVLCTRIERVVLPSANGAMLHVLITGTPALVTSVE
jgi:hypothetical protein